jgi:hypothetical protein
VWIVLLGCAASHPAELTNHGGAVRQRGLSVAELRAHSPDGGEVTVEAYVVYVYKCQRPDDAGIACQKPHLYLNDVAGTNDDHSLTVADLPYDTRFTVGQKIMIRGRYATESPRGFADSRGLLVYEGLEP